MITLKFPTLEFIKSHKRHPNPKDKEYFEEYEWDIFELDGYFAYCRIKYNEDDNGQIFLDMMCNGYCDTWTPYGFNKAYPATKKGYEKLQYVANNFVNELISNISESNDSMEERWE